MVITVQLSHNDVLKMDALPPMPGQYFEWPEEVVVVFPSGEAWSRHGGYNAADESIDYNPSGRGEINSPCHRALRLAGLLEGPPNHEVRISGIDLSMPSAWELAED